MTYYRKYRPKRIEDLDLEKVREQLTRIVTKGTFAHAYLFFGPKGTGKTSAARILASKAGIYHSDLIEIDAASHTGVDDIRSLREQVGLVPLRGDRKAYIIDEVHMLSRGAFNALLKTLEEPPEHVLFFLCTTEKQRVPETVVSRCVQIPFLKATINEIVRALERTAVGEKLTLEDGVLEDIAESVDGSFREAQTVLEESTHEGKVTKETVEKVLGGSISSSSASYIEAILAGRSKEALRAVSQVVQQGADIERFARLVLSGLRQRLLENPTPRILGVTRIVEERIRTIHYAPLPQLTLEIAALELAGSPADGSNVPPERAGKSVSSSSWRSPKKTVFPTATDHDATPEEVPAVTAQQINQRQPSLALEQVSASWPAILETVRRKNHGIVTLLSLCTPVAVVKNVLTLEVRYKFHKEQLEQQRFRTLIESVIAQIFGSTVSIRFLLGEKTQTVLKQFSQDDNIQAVGTNELSDIVEEIFSK